MSDERWLSKDERDAIGGWFQTLQPSAEAYEHGADLLDHAEAADELIRDMHEWIIGTACITCYRAIATHTPRVSDCNAYAEGERAATERIIGILKTVQAIDYNAPIGEQPYMVIGGIIDEIREGRA